MVDNTDVDLVISAHIHGFEQLYNNGITYINNGAGGSWQQFHYICEQPGATNTATRPTRWILILVAWPARRHPRPR